MKGFMNLCSSWKLPGNFDPHGWGSTWQIWWSGMVRNFIPNPRSIKSELSYTLIMLSSPKLTWPLKINGWKMNFLLGRPIFRGYASFRECIWVTGTARLQQKLASQYMSELLGGYKHPEVLVKQKWLHIWPPPSCLGSQTLGAWHVPRSSWILDRFDLCCFHSL